MRFAYSQVSVSRAALLLFPLLSLLAAHPVAGEAYRDRLIDPEAVADMDEELQREAAAEPEGRRFYSIEYQHYRQDFGDHYSEDGLLFNWRRETLHLGELSLDATVRNGGDESVTRHQNSGQFTFRQRGFALDEDHVMDNTAGVLRSQSDAMITSSFRTNLSSTLLGGLQSHIRGRRGDLYLGAGRIGRLDPTQVQGFEDTRGELFSLGYSQSLGQHWRAGTHLVHMTATDDVVEHQSLASALQYVTPGRRGRYVGHLLLDSEGNNGTWLDGDTRAGYWRHRYGLFRMEPELLWTDISPTDDQQGGYWRSEMASLRINLTAGLDYTQTNIDDRQDRAGVELYNAFTNGNWRMTSRTTLGSSLVVRASEPRNGIPSAKTRSYNLSGYASRRFRIGTSRLQLTASRLERDDESGNGYGIIWDQEWRLAQNLSMSSTLSHTAEAGLSDNADVSTAALLVHHQPDSRFYWNGDISYSVVDSDEEDTRKNVFTSLALFWSFLPDWEASLRATYNKLDDIPGSGTTQVSEDEKTLLLSIRYSHGSGRPFAVVGQQAEGVGYGEISGQVFYDANADGVRQAAESVAAGIYVYLDGRYDAVTDGQGRYSFRPVASGSHELSLAVEDLPLPWGLLDEAPRSVNVTVRGRSEIDFALQKINQ